MQLPSSCWNLKSTSMKVSVVHLAATNVRTRYKKKSLIYPQAHWFAVHRLLRSFVSSNHANHCSVWWRRRVLTVTCNRGKKSKIYMNPLGIHELESLADLIFWETYQYRGKTFFHDLCRSSAIVY